MSRRPSARKPQPNGAGSSLEFWKVGTRRAISFAESLPSARPESSNTPQPAWPSAAAVRSTATKRRGLVGSKQIWPLTSTPLRSAAGDGTTVCEVNGRVVAYASSWLPCALKTIAGPSGTVVVVVVAADPAPAWRGRFVRVAERPLPWHAR